MTFISGISIAVLIAIVVAVTWEVLRTKRWTKK